MSVISRICPECGDHFTTNRSDRHYCSDDCRSGEHATSNASCPACGSTDHDGWTEHADCPEDWTVLSKFEARRSIQLICEQQNYLTEELVRGVIR